MKFTLVLSSLFFSLAGLVFSPELSAENLSPYLEIQENPNRAGGVYYAYPTEKADNTPAPKGYVPFYVSHYGRHGSRYLIADQDYTNILNMLRKGAADNQLTELGQKTLDDFERLMEEVRGRGGDLTPLGVRQHRGIAERLYGNYPAVFKGSPEVSARSTQVPRCILSMDAFCERLKELNPDIRTTREASGRYRYLNYHSKESNDFRSGDWTIEFDNYCEERIQPERMMKSLFKDPQYIRQHVKAKDLYWGLYWLAVDMQNVETKADFMDLFTTEELYRLWQCRNYQNYVSDGNYAPGKGLVVGNARHLLENIVESADDVISRGENGATLRFGHDGNLMPLAGYLELEGCSQAVADVDSIEHVFANYRISPMAGNIQMIFFRPTKKGSREDVIVKFLLNEKEIAIPVKTDRFPYYNWEDVKKYYRSQGKL